MFVWQQYGIRAWPTVVVIDPLGKVIGARQARGVSLAGIRFFLPWFRNSTPTGQLYHRKIEMDPIAGECLNRCCHFGQADCG
jgi:hypothetical protein